MTKKKMDPEAVSCQRQQHLAFVKMMHEFMKPEAQEIENLLPQSSLSSAEDRDIKAELEAMFDKLFGPVENNGDEG